MSRSQTVEAIILRTYDIGEADRYIILFTKEKGRLPVRARGVRKLKSRKGGSLIPFQHAVIELRESDAGFEAVSAMPHSERQPLGLRGFTDASQGFEVLLRLTQDDEPLPNVFQTSVAFLQACDEEVPHAPLAYTLRLLDILGFLPGEAEIAERFPLGESEKEFLHLAREGYFLRIHGVADVSMLERVRDRFLHDQLSTPLKVPAVIAQLGARG